MAHRGRIPVVSGRISDSSDEGTQLGAPGLSDNRRFNRPAEHLISVLEAGLALSLGLACNVR